MSAFISLLQADAHYKFTKNTCSRRRGSGGRGRVRGRGLRAGVGKDQAGTKGTEAN